MALTGTQFGLCLSSYWYMWLTNGLSGLLFIGIDIGIAAFFLKKFGNNKGKGQSNYVRPESGVKRPLSAANMTITDDVDETAASRKPPSRGARSARSDNSSTLSEHDDFAYATCDAINRARSQYSAGRVELNEQLSTIAQRWAGTMARTGKLEHSPVELRNYGRQTLGENYAAFFQTEITGDRMIKRWLKEGRKYDFGTDGRRDTENFTQLVWRGTQEIGVGRARSEDGNWWYGVVVFDPPGNIPNKYAENVLMPGRA